MPPPITTSSTSITAATGAMWRAIRRASSSTTSQRERRRPRGRPRRSRAPRRRGRARSRDRPPRPAGGRMPRSRSAHGIRCRARARRRARSRPPRRRRGGPGGARRASTTPGAEPGSYREEDEVVDPARDTVPLLAERREVDVVLERHRHAQAALRARHRLCIPSSPWMFSASATSPRSATDHARAPRRRRRRSQRSATSPAADQALLQLGGELECRLRRRRRRSSTSWRARISPPRSQIAPRRKRAPRSSPRTRAASGTGSKKVAP